MGNVRVSVLDCLAVCAALSSYIGLGACGEAREQPAGVMGSAGVPGTSAPAAGSGAAPALAGRGPTAGVGGGSPGMLAPAIAGSGAVVAAAGGGGAVVTGASGAGPGSAGAAGQGQAGAAGQLGAAGQMGAAGRAGANGQAGESSTRACSLWPAAMGEQQVSATIKVTGRFDGKLKRYSGSGALGGGGQDEGQGALFELADGAIMENVVIGAPAADGIHCKGSCTLRNVWWQDVGEDAATFMGSSASQTMTIECGGAKGASDKVFQHNGPGTMIVRSFDVQDFGKLYRSCGNCKTQHERHLELSQITAKGGKLLAGINSNYNDTARFKDIVVSDPSKKLVICERFRGNSSGDEPTKEGSGPDSHCIYSDADITWQ